MSTKRRGNKPVVADKKVQPTDSSPYVFQREKVGFDFKVKELPWTEKQKELINLILDKNTKCVFIKGPAGSSKTATAVYCGLKLLAEKRMSDIIFVRSAVESADSKLGFLPGDLNEKFNAYSGPLNEKLEELLETGSIIRLKKDNRIIASPVNYIRGLHWPVKYIIVDECQNLVPSEIITTITRLGPFSKLILLGDPDQSDLPLSKRDGFKSLLDIFSDEESKERGIFTFEFTADDIVRSEFVKFVIKKLNSTNVFKKLSMSI